MRLLKIFLGVLPCASVILAQNEMTMLNLLEPNSTSTVNLSGPVTIKWRAPEDAGWNLFDIIFHGSTADNGGTFDYTIGQNLNVSGGGQYVWDPTNVTDALARNQSRLSTGKDFYFQSSQYAARNSTMSALGESDKFAVEGYELMGSGGSLLRPQDIAVMAGIASVVVWMV